MTKNKPSKNISVVKSYFQIGIKATTQMTIHMKKEEIVITSGVIRGQIVILSLTIVFVIIFSMFFINTPSIASLSTLLVVTCILSFLNLLIKKHVDIKLQDDKVIFHNLWNKKIVNRIDVVDIKSLQFIFYYPFNPFIKVTTAYGHFVTKITHATRIYTSKGGMNRYIEQLKNQLHFQEVKPKVKLIDVTSNQE